MTASSVLSSPAKSREYRQDSQAVMAQHGRTFRMASRFLGAADAEAICEAVSRPNMRFVPIKTPEQQSVLSFPS